MSTGSLRRISAIVRKEIWHILRDWQTLLIIFLMPIIMMFLYGYALTMDLKEVKVIACDEENSIVTKRIISSIDATTLFDVIGVIPATDDIESLFKQYRCKLVFKFSSSFSRDLQDGGTPAPIQVLIDGSDQNTGTILRNLVEPLLQKIILDYLHIIPPKIVTVNTTVLYNQEQKSALFFIPGLIAILLILISALLTSLTITREKELGTLDQLLVSPVKPWEIIIGKIIPYIVLATIDGTVILLNGWIFFGVRISGSVLFLIGAGLIYIITALSMGLFFSTIAKNQQQAMMMVLPVALMPTVLLSGFVFPISSMPVFLQWIAHVIPATYFLVIIRAIILKGVGLWAVWDMVAGLSLLGFFFLFLSIKKFGVQK